jgi:peptidoglycan/LPS O-acetylase OafA/YrhL
LVISIAWTTPNDHQQVAHQSLFAALFLSNIGFWLENSYFDKAAFKPLLHLWSLGVEIQFYVLVPLIYWIIKKVKFGYVIIFTLSLIGCFVMVGLSTKTAFFWMPFRLWEFLIGYGAAHFLLNRLPVQATEGLAGSRGAKFLALALLLILLWLPVNGQSLSVIHGHPGLHALALCAITGIILTLGLPAFFETSWLGTLLEKIGTYSYSIYLVHFPIIVMVLYLPFSGTVLKTHSLLQSVTLAGLIMAASALLFFGVEKQKYTQSTRIFKHATLAIVSILLLYPSGTLIQEITTPEKYKIIDQAWTDRSTYRCGKMMRLLEPLAKSCEITPHVEHPSRTILLIGNSHADSIKTNFARVAQDSRIAVRFMVENTPLMDGGISPEGLIQEAKRHKVDALVLHYSPGSIQVGVIEKLVTQAQAEGMSVSFIMPVPVWDQHIPKALWSHLKEGTPLPTQTADHYLAFNHALLNPPRFLKVYDVVASFCQPQCLLMDQTGHPLYFDQSHLTLTGSARLTPVFERVISDLTHPR